MNHLRVPLRHAEGEGQLHALGGLLHLVGVGDGVLVDHVVVDQQVEVLAGGQGLDQAVALDGGLARVALALDDDAVLLPTRNGRLPCARPGSATARRERA